MVKYNLVSSSDMIKIVQEIDKNLLEAKNLRKVLTKNEQTYLNKMSNERRVSIKKR